MTEAEIESQTRMRAYAIWETEGCPEGRAVDHWLAAEAMSRPRAQPKTAAAERVGRRAKQTGPGTRSARSITPKTRATAIEHDTVAGHR